MATDLLNASTWQQINEQSKPHQVFKLDWSTYWSLDFADTFLPNVDCLVAKSLWMFDGASLFSNLQTSESKQFKFESNNASINLVNYTYPKTVAAAEAKNIVQVEENEVCSFIELHENNDIDIYFKFGSNFIRTTEKKLANSNIDCRQLQGKLYKTNLDIFKNYFNGELVHYNMMQFILKTIGFNDLSSLYKLDSSFAQNQLKQIAKEMGKVAFGIFMLSVFGKDIEIKAIYKLYENLLKDKVSLPKIIITQKLINGRKANYDVEKKQIILWEYFIDKALYDEKEKATLLIALVEEYGHHIDNLLRTDYSNNKKEDTDYLDEGAKFAFFFLTKTTLKLMDINFAKIEIPYFTGELLTNFELVKTVAKEIYTTENLYDSKPKEKIKSFGSGFKPGEHGGIALSALNNVFQTDEILKIYYGNWLRDYSQLLVGSTIRLTNIAKKEVEQSANLYILNLLKTNSSKISHEGWVQLLEIFVAKELVFDRENEGKFCHQYSDHLKTFRERYGTLTKDILGIYRPEEHIDNPKGLEDESKLPISFSYEKDKNDPVILYLYAGETAQSLEIEPNYLLKKYIYSESNIPFRPSSDIFMKQQIKLAAKYGRNKEGFRHLGAALHVIEDYFAHSNFIEVALRKFGIVQTDDEELKKYKLVYPWVEGMQSEANYGNIPIVTGIFLTDDTLASVLPKLADKMFPIGFNEYEKRRVGDRTFSDALITSILTDFSLSDENEKKIYGYTAAEWLTAYSAYLDLVDYKSAFINATGILGEFLDRFLQTISEVFDNFNNLAFHLLLQSTDEDVKELQTHQTNVNYGTNPTHTQLAKDALNHPMNSLAKDLAKIAVTDIGIRIKNIWETGNDGSGELLAKYIVNTYTLHPKNTNWEIAKVAEWALANKDIVDKFISPTPSDEIKEDVKRFFDNSIFKKLIF